MSECCGETGAYGIVLIIIALIISFLLGAACIAGAIFMFLAKRDAWAPGQRWTYLVGLIIAGVLILGAFVVACFFPLDRIAGMVGFAVIFFVELAVLIVFAVFLWLTYRAGDYWNINLGAVLVMPVGMAFCVIAILLLLIEGGYLGETAMVILIIIAIVLCFAFFLLIVGVIIWLVINNLSEGSFRTWMVIGVLVIAGVLQIAGVITSCFFALDLIAGAVGLIICALVAGIIMFIYAIFFFLARNSEDRAYKWTVFSVSCVCAFFLCAALIGLLCMGGLWVTNNDGEL